MDQLFTYKSLVHATAGACGGISAISLFYPLNSVRTRLQVSDSKGKFKSVFAVIADIIRDEGFLSLYRGWRATVLGLGVSNFVYFYTYNGLKAVFKSWLIARGGSGEIGPLLNLLIASVSGAINVVLTTPLWVVMTRLTVQIKAEQLKTDPSNKKQQKRPYKGIVDCFQRIIAEEGVPALWNGVGPSLILVSNPSIHFVSYEFFRKIVQRRVDGRGYGITALEFFLMGAAAKTVATVLTYPLQIAQSRLRASAKDDKHNTKKTKAKKSEPSYTGTADCLRQLYKRDGFSGWFRGMEAKLWQTVLTAAFQFLTYEEIAKLIFKVMMGADADLPPTVAGGHGEQQQQQQQQGDEEDVVEATK